MDLYNAVGLLAVIVLVLANGFFVATEFAIVAVRRSRLEQLIQEGQARARVAKHIVDHLDAYIAACQLGMVNRVVPPEDVVDVVCETADLTGPPPNAT